MHKHISQSALTDLLKWEGQTCLSLYMPMERSFPDREQNPVRYKNLLRQLSEQLGDDANAQTRQSLQQFEALLNDASLWNKPRGGLAVLASGNEFRVFVLQQSVPEQVRVDRQPYLQPLLRISQTDGHFQLLSLTRDKVRLFEGNQDSLEEVELHEAVPRNLEQALGTELTPKDQSGQPGGHSNAAEKAGGMTMHEAGGGGKQAEIDIDRERYFRAVDKSIIEHHSRSIPLILAALPRNQAAFRALSHNQQLLAEGVALDPALLDVATLRQHCDEIMTRRYNAWLDGLLERYGAAQGTGLTCQDLNEIGQGAVAGRVSLLLVESGRKVPGVVNSNTGAVDLYPAEEGSTDNGADVLDQLIPQALRNGAEVVVVSPGVMPTEAGVAAVFRF